MRLLAASIVVLVVLLLSTTWFGPYNDQDVEAWRNPHVKPETTSGDLSESAALAATPMGSVHRTFPEPQLLPALQGAVHDDLGDPVGQVSIEIESDHILFEAVTDESGGFNVSLADCGSPSHPVILRKRGWITHHTTIGALDEAKAVTLFPSGVLVGRVLGIDGNPIPGADIEATGTRGWHDSVISGLDGRFVLSAPPGNVVLAIHSATHADQRVLDLEFVVGKTTEESFRMHPGVSLSLIISDQNRRPLEGTRVRVFTGAGDDEFGVTDSHGNIVFDGLGAGTARVAMSCPDHAERIAEIAIVAETGEATHRYALAPAAPWSLSIVNDSGDPLEDYTITLSRAGVQVTRADSVEARALQVVASDHSYTVEVTHRHYATTRTRLIASAENPKLEVVLRRGGRLHGRVVDQLHQHLTSATILVTPRLQKRHGQLFGSPCVIASGFSGEFRSARLAAAR